MKDVQREKFAALMEQIDEAEDKITGCEANENLTDEEKAKLLDLKNKLAEKRTELRRISDGCGHTYH